MAFALSLLFLVPFLGTTLHRYHAAEHVQVHHCDTQRQQQQHLHDPDVLGWHHCVLCTVPGPIASPVVSGIALAYNEVLQAEPNLFYNFHPLLQARQRLSSRGPPAISC
jgi:hypothetical protein